ncbi:MAG: methionyl-tRNA formyltransferase [Gammaproteobacteria bacterium]|nr:methionyl-tRNA formyltransferase [Gammaproteobacteria bacterium]
MKNARVIFAGTPEFARASLAALVDSGVTPILVLTQPDRPSGRGKRVTASPVKRYAEEHDIAVMQPRTLRDAEVQAELAALKPDAMIVAAYGLILPQDVLDIPAQGCINVHASLLPRWRGAAPVQAAILAGDKSTGISLMAMTAGLDCGPVYLSESLSIADDETAGSLHDRLASLGGELLAANLDDILEQRIVPVAQDEAATCYAGKVQKQDAQLDWTRGADELQRRVRAYNPVPGAFFFASSEDTNDSEPLRIKCWRAERVAGAAARPGTVLSSDQQGVVVACGADALSLLELQLPGKRRIAAREFSDQLDLTGRVLG